MFLSTDNYLVVREDPMGDPYGFECRKSVHNYHVRVGELQLTILNELKVVAESAVFTERLLGLIREGVSVILGALGHDSTTVPTPNKQTEPPVKSPNPLTHPLKAILEGMVYYYDNKIETLSIKLLHEHLVNNRDYTNDVKTVRNDMPKLEAGGYVERPFKNNTYIRLTEMGRSLFPRSS